MIIRVYDANLRLNRQRAGVISSPAADAAVLHFRAALDELDGPSPLSDDLDAALRYLGWYREKPRPYIRGWGLLFIPRESLNKSSAAEQRIFCPIRTVWKTGNTSSIPPFPKLSPETKSPAVSS